MATTGVTRTPGIGDRLAARKPGAVFADAPVGWPEPTALLNSVSAPFRIVTTGSLTAWPKTKLRNAGTGASAR